MGVVCTLVFALAFLVNSIVCTGWNHGAPRERIMRMRIDEHANMWYREYCCAPRGQLYTLQPVKGTKSFLERDGIIIGFGQDYGTIRAMRDANGNAFVFEEGMRRRPASEEELMARGVGGRMPPFDANSREL
ncbi:uncharacterized protein LOC117171024 [Belonocnema kinseyi]|uniref:uncharacterized protein LOC117171024 n=1 Tax=Belonocnema kinseyi TaxID=2817044 RepID=UPI00143D6746|nr:uncharacterized protein LOC117171024 [Belonocnema kinseyi]